MVEIYLDGIQLEVPQDISIGMSLGVADYSDPVTASGAYTQTVEIPRTPHNDLAFDMAGEILSAEQYNHADHTARIVQDGCELIGGRAYLEGVSQYSYNLQIVGEEIEWVAKIRDKKLSELEGEDIGYYKPTDWGELEGVEAKGLPMLSWVLLQHGCWFQEVEDEKVRRSWVTYQDLVPIVKLHTLLEHIFAGYKIEASSSLNELLHRTYTTMKWKEDERASIHDEDMGFEITSNLLNANSDGELVVTIDDGNRRPIMPLFDTIVEDKNDVLSTTSDDRGIFVEFDPTEECTATFELKTKYQTSTYFHPTTLTDNTILWRDVAMSDPSFANQLFNPDEDTPFVEFDIKDSVEWKNKELLHFGDHYKKIYARHTEGALRALLPPSIMPLCYMEVDNPERYESIGYFFQYYYMGGSGAYDDVIDSGYIPSRTNVSYKQIVRTNVSLVSDDDGRDRYYLGLLPALRGKDGKIYVYERKNIDYGDEKATDVRVWGLSEDQRITFDVALRMPLRTFKQGYFYEISGVGFGSSQGGDGIKVYGTANGSLKPDFGWGVPIRGDVRLADVGGDDTAESMLRSIMQLYNILIYTNPKTKRVHLHSFADFWSNNIVDWRDRMDADSDISIVYLGDSIGKEIALSYAEGSPRIDYYNERHDIPYFAFKKALPNKMAKDSKEVQNELFTPAYLVDVAKEFDGGSGVVPAVASKDKEGDVLEFTLSDVPHTLMFIDSSDKAAPSQLPLNTSVFGDIGGIQPSMVAMLGNTTLSFANKEGKMGLHQYYDKQIKIWEKGKRLTCYCRVEAWEIEALRYNSDNINFRSLFHLNINGEDIYARLESIEYEPSNTTNKCTFIIE